MFIRVLRHEIKNIFRDKMYFFLMVYPFVFGIIGYFLVPYLNENSHPLAGQITALVIILMTGFVFGAITGFTLLDDQDDHVIEALKVTPISVKSYVASKLVLSYLFALISCVILILFTGFLEESPWNHMLMIIVLLPLQTPIYALLINMFSRNKVEGFVMMKFTGMILLVPIASIFLTDWKELFLGLLPSFWATRLIAIEIISKSYFFDLPLTYFLFGLLMNLLVLALFFTIYQKRIES